MTKDLQTRLSEDGKRIAALERQRDRLAEALREILRDAESGERDRLPVIASAARAALAELEKP